MTEAIAMTFKDDDRGIPAEVVVGQLTTRYIATLDYTQYSINGVLVDPATIEIYSEDGTTGNPDANSGNI